MQFPVTISVGSLHIPLHPVFETLGIYIGFRYFLFLRKKQGDVIDSPKRTWILIAAFFGAFIGSRLIGGLENPDLLMHSVNKLAFFYQNKTVLGGFLGGLFAVEIAKKMIGEKQASGDLFVYPMMLALIIGRVGCFTMGVYEETYGTVTALPWAINLGDGLMRHPVTLYEILFLFLMWLLIAKAYKKWSFENGARFKIFMMAYLCFRFLLDFIKPHYTFGIGLSTIQLTCIIGLIWYSNYFISPRKLLLQTK